MHRPAFEEGSPRDGVPLRESRPHPVERLGLLWREPVERRDLEQLPVEPKHRAERSIAEPRRACHYGVEHWLDVGRRATDDAENLARRRLALQGLPCLVEQSYILDGDHRLVGKGLEERDLFVRERICLGAPEPYRAYRHPLPQ